MGLLLFLTGCNDDPKENEKHKTRVYEKEVCTSLEELSKKGDCNLSIQGELVANDVRIRFFNEAFLLTKNLKEVEDPEIFDQLIVPDSLAALKAIVCSDTTDLGIIELPIESEQHQYDIQLNIKRHLDSDPDIYGWSITGKSVYDALIKYCK